MSNLQIFKVLGGLPGDGSPPIQFSSSGQGTHREGYVVQFCPENGGEWTGNFQPGLTGLYRVIFHPNGQYLIVIAGGEAYVIDPVSRELIVTFGGFFESVVAVSSLNSLLFSNGLWFELYGANGLEWKTRRLSWDGIRNIELLDSAVVGEGWCFDESWHRFSVDLSTGACTGGAYNGSEF